VNLPAAASDWLRHTAQRNRMTPERSLGRRGEDIAHRFLQKNGYTVVARNYRTPSGGNEVDLIAWQKQHLVFVEVKTRQAESVSAPERAVTPEKQRRIVRAAMDYTRRAKVEWGWVRFDVVAITDSRPPLIELFVDAFGAEHSLY
jgi:putative endonuclease